MQVPRIVESRRKFSDTAGHGFLPDQILGHRRQHDALLEQNGIFDESCVVADDNSLATR